MLFDLYNGPCPTCGGDGSDGNPFDGHCPAEWAHRFLNPSGPNTAHDMGAYHALRMIGRAPTPVPDPHEQREANNR